MSAAGEPPRAVGLDVGGTKIEAGAVGGDGSVDAVQRADSPVGDADAVVDVCVELVAGVERACPQAVGAPVGVGAPGLVDADGALRTSPNLDVPGLALGRRLAERLGRPVRVENDGQAAAWGEHRVGAGAGVRGPLVAVTVGTGLGGGLVVDGRLLRGVRGFAGELGHVVVAEGGPACPCGNRGCLAALVSGAAIARAGREALARAGEPQPADAALDGVAVTDAALDGRAWAEQAMAEVGGWLGVGLAGVANLLDPEVICVAGGAARAGERLLGPAREALRARLLGASWREPPEVRTSGLGAHAGVVGAGLVGLDRP